MDNPQQKSAPSLFGDLARQLPDLFRKELQLLRAEIGEKADQAARALGMIVAAIVIALTALNVLAAALVAAIENAGVAPGWSALIVGVVLAGIALALAGKGSNDLKASSLKPQRTVNAVAKDAQMAKETVS